MDIAALLSFGRRAADRSPVARRHVRMLSLLLLENLLRACARLVLQF